MLVSRLRIAATFVPRSHGNSETKGHEQNQRTSVVYVSQMPLRASYKWGRHLRDTTLEHCLIVETYSFKRYSQLHVLVDIKAGYRLRPDPKIKAVDCCFSRYVRGTRFDVDRKRQCDGLCNPLERQPAIENIFAMPGGLSTFCGKLRSGILPRVEIIGGL